MIFDTNLRCLLTPTLGGVLGLAREACLDTVGIGGSMTSSCVATRYKNKASLSQQKTLFLDCDPTTSGLTFLSFRDLHSAKMARSFLFLILSLVSYRFSWEVIWPVDAAHGASCTWGRSSYEKTM